MIFSKNKNNASQKNSKKTTISVTLKPFKNIQPVVYVPIIWLLLLLMIIVIFNFPALSYAKGQYVYVQSQPSNTAVFVDNMYKGSTNKKNLRLLLNAGAHTIRVSLPSFQSYTQELTIKNQFLFRTLPFQRKDIKATLSITNEQQFIQNAIQNIASWNILAYNNSRYPMPPLLKTYLNQIANAYHDSTENIIAKQESLQTQFFQEALPYLHTDITQLNLAKDITKQINTLQQKQIPIVLTSPNINNKISNFEKINFDNKFIFLPVQKQVLEYKKIEVKASKKNLHYLDNMYNNGFNQQTSKDTSDNKKPTLQVFTSNFYVLEKEVTQSQFNDFLQDNITWTTDVQTFLSPDTKDTYLKDFNPQKTPTLPMRYISFYDALEFTKWFNKNIAPQGWKAKIPNEFQWRAAARIYARYDNALLDKQTSTETDPQIRETMFSQKYFNSNSATNLIGSLWEWTSSWYSPLPQFASFDGPQYGSEKIILGGSYISQNVFIKDVLETESRNLSADPHSVSPYLGFRIILVSNK